MIPEDHLHAAEHLSRADDKLASVIERLGPPQMGAEPEAWRALSSSIIGQQISTHAARAVRGRFAALVPDFDFPAPHHLPALSDETLRGAGLSANKARSIRDLAAHFEDGRLSNEKLRDLSDEDAIAALIPVRGIGRWTAEMFLIFSLGRLDIWAVDDLGLRNGVRKLYELEAMPDLTTLRRVAEPWRPYRSVASWYLWRMQDG